MPDCLLFLHRLETSTFDSIKLYTGWRPLRPTVFIFCICKISLCRTAFSFYTSRRPLRLTLFSSAQYI